MGASTDQAQSAIADETVRIVRAFVERGEVPNCVNLATRSPAAFQLVVRHFDKVGVLAEVLGAIRRHDINVEEMENTIFEGAQAASAKIRLASRPPAELLDELRGKHRRDPARRRGGAAGVIALAPVVATAWVRAACADLRTLLVDHAHCEKKAASTAVRYLFKYPDWPALVRRDVAAGARGAGALRARPEASWRCAACRSAGCRSANYAAELFARPF